MLSFTLLADIGKNLTFTKEANQRLDPIKED
jgi:hypothetical protein